MFSSRWSRRIVTFLILLFLAGGALLACLHLYLPRYLESSVLPQLAQQAGLSVSSSVRRVGLGGADLANITVGYVPAESFLKIDSIRVDYSFSGLLTKRIDRILVSGVSLHIVATDSGFTLPGDTSRLENKKSADSQREPFDMGSMPFTVAALAIHNGAILCDYGGKTVRLPFGFAASLPHAAGELPQSNLTLYPDGREVVVAARLDRRSNEVHAELTAHDLELAALAAYFPGLSRQQVGGRLDLNGRFKFHLAPFSIDAAFFKAEIRDGELASCRFPLRQATKTVAQAQLHGDGQGGWHLNGSGFSLGDPWNVGDVSFESNWRQRDGGIKGDGKLTCKLPAQGNGSIRLKEALSLSASITAARESDGKWRASLVSDQIQTKTDRVVVGLAEMDLTTSLPRFKVLGSGDGRTSLFSWNLGFAEFVGQMPDGDGKISIPSLVVFGQGGWPAQAQKEASVNVVMPEFNLAQGDYRFKISDTSLQLPFADNNKSGLMLVRGMQFQDQALGGIKAEVNLNKMGLEVNAVHRSLLLPGLECSFNCEGKLGSEGITAAGSYETPEYQISAPFDLGTLIPAMSGFTLDGIVAAKGKFGMDQCGIKASLATTLHDGTLELAARKFTLEGVDLDFAFSDLALLRSDLPQRLRFKQATLGDLVFSDGAVDFQLEPLGLILIESGSCRWCKGRLDMKSIRFTPSVKAYDLVLYCDRLHFATLLEQLGAARGAVGDGRLNGRIALHVEKGNLRFEDGFLYSTPGDGGSLRLTGSERLSAGIPTDTVQFTQIDLAREALKDYNYDWARLSISSEGENLLLGLQLNGKPAKPLPFVYRKDIGGFARVEADSPGSVFQGIRLDVNFRLPINTILNYGSNIQDLLR